MEVSGNKKTCFLNKNRKRNSIIFLTALILLAVYRQNDQRNVRPEDIRKTDDDERCDIFKGEWVPNPNAPYYTNETCRWIQDHQNCMKYGRPDTEYLKWKWKPDGCDLQVFDPFKFLDIIRNKSLAFVGDSVGRNQLQSLICLLSRVENPIETSDKRSTWFSYVKHNFTLANFWSPFLIRSDERDSNGSTQSGPFKLYIDEPDESWTSQIDEFDYLVLNAGHWFTRPTVYYENRRVSGCLYCQLPNISNLPNTYAYRRAFHTSFKAIEERERFNGVVFLRTFAPSHFENGPWNAGGDCVRRRPWRRNETNLEGNHLEMYLTQMEEFRAVEREGKKRFRLLDTTSSVRLRPDGHPSRYGHWPNANVSLYNDCVHWCLPGPIDTWADFLLHMLKIEFVQ